MLNNIFIRVINTKCKYHLYPITLRKISLLLLLLFFGLFYINASNTKLHFDVNFYCFKAKMYAYTVCVCTTQLHAANERRESTARNMSSKWMVARSGKYHIDK